MIPDRDLEAAARAAEARHLSADDFDFRPAPVSVRLASLRVIARDVACALAMLAIWIFTFDAIGRL